MAHVRQSRPYSGLGFQVKSPKTFQVVVSLLGSGTVSNLEFPQVRIQATSPSREEGTT